MNDQEQTTHMLGPIKLDTLLTILIAVLSLITAYSAYTSAQIDSAAGDLYADTQVDLIENNTHLILTTQREQMDMLRLDLYAAHVDEDPVAAQRFLDGMSLEGVDYVNVDEGYFEDPYYDRFVELDIEWLEALIVYDAAFVDSARAVGYQLTVLIMAVGLSFAAWASLSSANFRMRMVFMMMAIVALVAGIYQMTTVPDEVTLPEVYSRNLFLEGILETQQERLDEIQGLEELLGIMPAEGESE